MRLATVTWDNAYPAAIPEAQLAKKTEVFRAKNEIFFVANVHESQLGSPLAWAAAAWHESHPIAYVPGSPSLKKEWTGGVNWGNKRVFQNFRQTGDAPKGVGNHH